MLLLSLQAFSKKSRSEEDEDVDVLFFGMLRSAAVVVGAVVESTKVSLTISAIFYTVFILFICGKSAVEGSTFTNQILDCEVKWYISIAGYPSCLLSSVLLCVKNV